MLLGGLYALFAMGLSLIFGVMRLVNIAHGDFIVLAAFLALVVGARRRSSAGADRARRAAVMFAVGYVLQRGVLNRTLGPDILPPLLVTFGLSIIIQNVLLEVFSADSRALERRAGCVTASLRLGERLWRSAGFRSCIFGRRAGADLRAASGCSAARASGGASAPPPTTQIAQLMGIRQPPRVRAGDGHRVRS